MKSPAKTSIVRSSLGQQAVALMRAKILAQELAPGQRLDEAVLAAQLGISRTPLREALKTLAAEGLVEQRPRRGCFVSEMSFRDLEEIFPIMAMLEGRVAFEAAVKSSPADLKRLEALHEKLQKHAAAGDVDRYYAVNYEFHDALQQVAGSRWLRHLIGDLRRMLKLSRHRSLMLPGRLAESMAEHEALMEALRTGKARSAEKIMNRHLLNQLEALRRVGAGAEAA